MWQVRAIVCMCTVGPTTASLKHGTGKWKQHKHPDSDSILPGEIIGAIRMHGSGQADETDIFRVCWVHRCPAQLGTVQSENGRNPGAARRLHLTFAYSPLSLILFIHTSIFLRLSFHFHLMSVTIPIFSCFSLEACKSSMSILENDFLKLQLFWDTKVWEWLGENSSLAPTNPRFRNILELKNNHQSPVAFFPLQTILMRLSKLSTSAAWLL